MPYFHAFDHITAGDEQVATGDGGLSSVAGTGTSIVDGAGSLGRNVLRLYAHASGSATFKADSASLVIAGGRTYQLSAGTVSIPAGAGLIMGFANAAGTLRVQIKSTASSDVCELMVNGTTVVDTFTLPFQAWTYLEMAAKISASADGWVVVYVDGLEVARATAVVTGAAADIDNIVIASAIGSGSYRSDFTDLYSKAAADDVDAPGFYGPILMRLLNPTTDVAEQWTPSAGSSNVAMVDEAQHDSETTYVETNVVDTEDQYEIEDLPSGVNSIIAVVVGTVARAPNGGAPLVSHTLEIDAAKDTGAGHAVGTTAYRTQQTVFLTAPDDSALSESKVNSARIGIVAA